MKCERTLTAVFKVSPSLLGMAIDLDGNIGIWQLMQLFSLEVNRFASATHSASLLWPCMHRSLK